MFKHDLIVIGGGILGLSHAYHALKKGLKVLMIEKNYQAMGASILNFGQVVPSGFGVEWQKYGIASTKHYLDIAAKADIFVRKEGSIYIASDEDEMTLIEELHQINTENAYSSQLLTAHQCKEKYPMLKDSYVKGALFFPDEINADSRKTIPAITNYLVQGLGLKLIFGKRIVDIYETENEAIVFDTAGDKWVGGQVVICNGNEYQSLFPEEFPIQDIQLVKLQMMETVSQQDTVPGSILTGWTIRRYESFSECPSYYHIKHQEDKTSFQNQLGVHILFKQTASGSIILGDSHEYATVDKEHQLQLQDNNQTINDFMIAEAKKIINLDFTIARTWVGCYSQYKKAPIFHKKIDHRVHVVTAIGGKGMTASLGWAEEHINKLF
jgi:FAD dependent oxidoreductase TIGR03364